MKKVLVIEDNPDNMRLITYVLRRGGYEVIPVFNGEDGVRVAIETLPFFILLDMNLPDIDGLEVVKRLRASEIDDSIPIVAVTSRAMAGDRERIMAAGCTAYFEKPIDPLTILDRIHEILGLPTTPDAGKGEG